jgi:dTDP-glucose pyrophosphorylase/CBS domain-containing protein
VVHEDINIQDLCTAPDATIRQAIQQIDLAGMKLVLVTDEQRRLLGTVSDGDIRRAILAGTSLESPVTVLLEQKASGIYPKPVTAPVGTPRSELLALMNERTLTRVPLLDEEDRVVDLATLEELLPDQETPLQAVIMAGGKGTRLRPLTEDLPKPMLPVGGKPLMEQIVSNLQKSGIKHINVSTLYKPEKIVDHFGDGSEFGVELNYVNEDEPLGTGGALGLLSPPDSPLLVINGDILTQVDFRVMLAFHQENSADLTVAVREYKSQVPYGVVECKGTQVTGLREKPELTFFVNAGIYLLEPSVFELIPGGKHFNMTDLIEWLIESGRTVVSFPIREYWLDIGQHADYRQAQEDMENGKLSG